MISENRSNAPEEIRKLKNAMKHVKQANVIIEKLKGGSDEIYCEFLNLTRYGLKTACMNLDSALNVFLSAHEQQASNHS